MRHLDLFDRIAPMYAWFYTYQRQAYKNAADLIMQRYPKGSTLLDVGCGTGALSALVCTHFHVSAVDGAPKMIQHAQRLHPNDPIEFSIADVLRGLPFADRSMDVVLTSFVLHGLSPTEREKALDELTRISRLEVLVLDYYRGRNLIIDLVERLENGHYFSFMASFEDILKQRFASIEIMPLNATSALYALKKTDA